MSTSPSEFIIIAVWMQASVSRQLQQARVLWGPLQSLAAHLHLSWLRRLSQLASRAGCEINVLSKLIGMSCKLLLLFAMGVAWTNGICLDTMYYHVPVQA